MCVISSTSHITQLEEQSILVHCLFLVLPLTLMPLFYVFLTHLAHLVE